MLCWTDVPCFPLNTRQFAWLVRELFVSIPPSLFTYKATVPFCSLMHREFSFHKPFNWAMSSGFFHKISLLSWWSVHSSHLLVLRQNSHSVKLSVWSGMATFLFNVSSLCPNTACLWLEFLHVCRETTNPLWKRVDIVLYRDLKSFVPK